MKIAFAGSPGFSVPALAALCDGGYEVVAVITRQDKPVGRKKILTPTPVKAYALERGLPVYDFPRIRDCADEVRAIGADILITCAYGQILSREILDCFPSGVWNLHASLLPLFRGASPIQSAILAGETHTGITVMRTEEALDTGAILLVKRCEIGDADCGELEKKLSYLAAEAAVEAVGLLKSGQTQLLMQDEARATYCTKIQKSDCKIDFTRSAEEILRLIRAMNPEPIAYCNQNGQPLNILKAQKSPVSGGAGEVLSADKRGILVGCGSGSLLIEEIIPSGGKRMRAADYVNGRKIKVGDRLD